ncbi:MAG: hypothetical protein WDO18_18850 [Acidobacteriota bacterium]
MPCWPKPPLFPSSLTCEALSRDLKDGDGSLSTGPRIWDRIQNLFGGSYHVSAVNIDDGGRHRGFIVMVQDMSFLGRRSATTRTFLLIAFGFLSLAAAAVTVSVARFSRRDWSAELRTMLRGNIQGQGARTQQHAEFQPILHDVHETGRPLDRRTHHGRRPVECRSPQTGF